MIDRSAAVTAARSQALPGLDGAPYRTNDSARSKAVTHHLTAEPRRLKSKREAMERRKQLAARTGSLYDFIGHTPSPSSSLHTSSLIGGGKPVRRTPCERSRGQTTRANVPGKLAENVSRNAPPNGAITPQARSNTNERRASQHRGSDGVPLKAASPSRAGTEGVPTSSPLRLQETLNKYRYFADPVTSQREALRSLQAKNSLYPTLRFAQPWDGMDFDPLDEYLSSSSSAYSSGDDLDTENVAGSGSEDHGGSGGGGGTKPPRSKAPASRRPTEKVASPARRGSIASVSDPTKEELKARSTYRRDVRQRKRDLRQRRQEMTRRRRAFNAAALAAEEDEREAGLAASAQAAAAEAEAAEARSRPVQVDVSKLAHFRYSKVKGTLELASEEDWVSDGLYEGSSVAASDAAHGEGLPAEFYGSGARPRFYDLYRLVHRQKQTVDDDEALEEAEFTPRRLFLRDTLARGITPSPTMMRSRKDPYTLDLGFQGLGDQIGLSLATTLPLLPNLASLNLRENRLTDASLDNILAEAVRLECLTSLDLSCNKIDHSALVLREYVASARCKLQRLSLSNADVDDDECNSLMEALAGNVSVKALDLSHNMIGDKETYNFVRPDYTTGGEAVAEMIETNTTLSSLDLSWNSVRMASGVSLGESLAHNSALTELKVAHNSLADAGVQAIAQSLRSNGSLRLLDISFNNMKPRSAMVLANALLDNTSLDHLMMSHNNVGRRGATAVFMALRQRAQDGVELLVDLQSCELGSDAGDDLFDMHNPSGRYELDMSKPYDYMVARMLLNIANKSEGLELSTVEHASGERGMWKPVALARRTPISSQKNGGDNFQPSESFGEKVLGAGGGGGDWRVPAAALLTCSAEGESGREANPEELESFFRELGLQPTPTIAEKICEAFNAGRRIEQGPLQGNQAAAAASEDGSGGDGDTAGLAPDPVDGRLAGPGARDVASESVDSRPSTPRRPASAARKRGGVPTAGSSKSSREDPVDGRSSDCSGSTVTKSSRSRNGVKTPFDMAKHVFHLLFLEVDVDRSGCIDNKEFGEMLLQLGKNIGPDVARHCIASYDIDRSNTIEADEFVDFMTHEFLAPALPSPGVLCEASGNRAWTIPREGRLRMTVLADYVAPAPIEVASQEAVDSLISNIRYSAKTEQDRLEMFQLATEGTDFYMTSLNAQALIDEWNNGMNLVDILEILLPQMSSDRNVVSLIENNLTYAQKLELRSKLGQSWGPLVGNPTGTYCLDMSDRKHLIAAKRLAMINHAEKGHGISGAAGRHDTSQRGYWNNFRNETFNGLPFAGRGMEGRWFVNNPPKGKVRLDYVSTTRPFPGTRPLSDRRFRQLLTCLDLGDMRRSTEHPFLFEQTPEQAAVAIAAAAAVDRVGSMSTGSASTHTAAGTVSNAHMASKAASIVAKAEDTAPAISQPKRTRVPRVTMGTATAAAAGESLLCSPRIVLRPLTMIPALPQVEGEAGGVRGDRSFRSRSTDQGSTSLESANLREMEAAHAMVKEGLLRPITPDQILAFHAEYQVSSKSERRRAWAIVELGHPLVPDEDVETGSRGSVRTGESKGSEGGDRAGSTPGDELPPDSKGEDPPNEEVDGDRGNPKQHELHDDLGVASAAVKAASVGPAVAIAAPGAGKSEPPELTESKPSFGDKQKPLYHMPLKWRKVIGKPQYAQDYKQALSKLCELKVQVLRHWLTAKQVITTMNFFPRCDSLRVIVATTLFGRLVDLENTDLILDEFTQAESDEFLWRIGPLNVYNPKKPDRTYDLDLAHRDDREVCKVLAGLAVGEPGENWVNEEYSWSYAQRPVPGWELPMSWTTPDSAHNGGPRHCGRLTLRYSSDPATGCAPKWKLRETLMAHVLAGDNPHKLR
ncbi:unnamed protein product [Ectocarpus fasciculatus]